MSDSRLDCVVRTGVSDKSVLLEVVYGDDESVQVLLPVDGAREVIEGLEKAIVMLRGEFN
jgi:hypothetical protein